MCGIAGIFEYRLEKTVCRDALLRMNAHMQSRGPDGANIWIHPAGFVGFAHRRLSIIDLSDDAKQPMQLHQSELYITFNGEIYNYRALRNDLIKVGHVFKTQSDTEVILKLYQLYGSDMLLKLRGMFAFAIWDEQNKTLFCARDPFGIKPFYFSDNGRCFQFASQVKTLLTGASDHMDTRMSAAGHIGFYTLGSVPEPYTLYAGIQSLPAGSFLRIDQHGKKIKREYYSVKSELIHAENHIDQMDSLSLQNALQDTVSHHLVADVDVGIFLSAGIDSSTLVNAVSNMTSKPPTTITLGFSEYQRSEKNEVPLAKLVSDIFNTHQKTVFISEKEAIAERETILQHMDQPTIDGINTYFVSKIAAQQGLKVALSGLGADEIFSGYPHFLRIQQWLPYTKLLSFSGPLFRKLTSHLFSAKYASILEYGQDVASAYFLARALHLPWELEKWLDRELIQKGWDELNLLERLRQDIRGIHSLRFQISALELQWYMRNQLLRDADWAGMSHSLEIRVPFVDIEFFKQVISLSARKALGKQSLAQALNRKLPDAILYKKKTGFNIPVSQWFAKTNNMKSFSTFIYQQFVPS